MKDKNKSRSGTPGPAANNESVTSSQPGDPHKSGQSVQRRGENLKKNEHESGRHDTGTQGSTNRPKGKSTARDSTGVDPKGPIDPDSPHLIPS